MSQKEYHRRWYQRNKKTQAKNMRLWYKKNKKKANATSRAWHKQNIKRAKRLARKWYLRNREAALIEGRKRHHKNKKRANLRSQAYRKKNHKRCKVVQRRWQKKNGKDSSLRRFYGIDMMGFIALRKAQANRCAICRKLFKKTPYVDHNHRTAAVRGLLCITCNSGLGMLQDSIPVLKSAIKYLRRSVKCV